MSSELFWQFYHFYFKYVFILLVYCKIFPKFANIRRHLCNSDMKFRNTRSRLAMSVRNVYKNILKLRPGPLLSTHPMQDRTFDKICLFMHIYCMILKYCNTGLKFSKKYVCCFQKRRFIKYLDLIANSSKRIRKTNCIFPKRQEFLTIIKLLII